MNAVVSNLFLSCVITAKYCTRKSTGKPSGTIRMYNQIACGM